LCSYPLDINTKSPYYIFNGYICCGYKGHFMPDTALTPQSQLPLTPAVFHILLALADGEKHGYGIMQEVALITDGTMHMGPGTLYGTIKRLLESSLIEESDERPDPALDDERRRYYRLTSFGERVAQAEARRLAALLNVAAAKRLMGGASG
jgi:DNA-binding PadR family transcriptional regulator